MRREGMGGKGAISLVPDRKMLELWKSVRLVVCVWEVLLPKAEADEVVCSWVFGELYGNGFDVQSSW